MNSPTPNSRQRAERAGRWAEIWVGLYLIATGHRILSRRFRARTGQTSIGEVDLIALGPPWRRKTIIFIEVKQRRKAAHAIDPVSARSEERIIRAGEVWLSRRPHFSTDKYGLRYDVITVIGRGRIGHLRDAFRGW